MKLVLANEAPEGSHAAGTDQQLYERYTPLVRRIAMKTIRSLPSSVSLDDLLSAGWIGLAEALRRRTANMTEEQFEAYASHRVQGAILDYLRTLDPLSRRLRGASRRITEVSFELTQRLGREPTEEEIAGELGITLETYYQLLTDIADAGLARLELNDATMFLPDEGSPESIATRKELLEVVASAIDALPERLRLVLSLYYEEDCNFREVGEVLGVTESRACQMHTEAVHRVRAKIRAPAPLAAPGWATARTPAPLG
ncbi:MAG: RNA polymerase sigma factor FliA [Polyangiaceae bacterium]|nr:RNA polymerase sigma factor FliA [Polyangiaceae bacterium]